MKEYLLPDLMLKKRVGVSDSNVILMLSMTTEYGYDPHIKKNKAI